jgi:hypothetical protein
MLSKLLERLQGILKPYTLEDFIEDSNPKDYKDIQRLEAQWQKHRERRFFNTCI